MMEAAQTQRNKQAYKPNPSDCGVASAAPTKQSPTTSPDMCFWLQSYGLHL